MIPVILMAYGSPMKMEDVLPYLQGIYDGKPVPDYAIKENTEKYAMVNGISPSNAIIDRIIEKLQKALSSYGDYAVSLGNKHWHPYLHDVLQKMKDSEVEQIIGLPLFPFKSTNVRNSYLEPTVSSMESLGMKAKIKFVNGFEPTALASLWHSVMRKYAIDDETAVLFDAHSLPLFHGPEKEYDDAFMETSRLIADRLGLKKYFHGYQSRGKYGKVWLEPSIFEVLEQIRDGGFSEVLAVPTGFIYEHLEILYDLDHEFGEKVRDSGLIYIRSELPDDSQEFISLLRDCVLKEAGEPVE